MHHLSTTERLLFVYSVRGITTVHPSFSGSVWSECHRSIAEVTRCSSLTDSCNLTTLSNGDRTRTRPIHSPIRLLLLLTAPTWLWGRCGRHNFPPASSVMDLVFRRSDGYHVSVDTAIHLCFGLPSFLLPGGTISRVFLPPYSWSRLFAWPNHLSRAFLHLSAILSTFSLSLMFSFLTWSLSVAPHAPRTSSFLSLPVSSRGS